MQRARRGGQAWRELYSLLPTVYKHLALIVAVLGPLDKLYDPYNSAL